MNHDNLLLVLQHRYAGKAWCYNGDGYDGLHWTDETLKPTEKQLLAQIDEVAKEIEQENENRAQAAASAKIKLKSLGLTDAEIDALIS